MSSDLKKAYSLKMNFFGETVKFCYPKGTQPVSVTGSHCKLKCAHCDSKHLQHMHPVDKLMELPKRLKSLLVSGGCTVDGKVPITEKHLKDLSNTKLKLNVHSGLVDRHEAKMLGKYAETVSFDFVADKETIWEVYGLDKMPKDYEDSYKHLLQHCRVVPHVCVGLLGGQIKGEKKALDKIKELSPGIPEITLILFMPTKGTRFEEASPPDLNQVKEIFLYARHLFPKSYVNLGCMRPKGIDYDVLALKCGFNKIVCPSKKAEEFAKTSNLKVEVSDECCVL